VLTAQDRRRVEVFVNAGGGEWSSHVYASGDVVELPSLNVTLSAAELYDAAGLDVR